MKKSLMVACFLAVGGSAVGVSAGSPASIKGSDTLFDFTNAIIAGCPGTAGPPVLAYAGTGSGNGEKGMTTGAQTIAPMSRFMNKNVCAVTATLSPTTSQGLVVGLDGVSVVGSKSTFASTACNGDSNAACDPTFEPTTGAAYNTTITTSTGTYTFADWRDVLRVLFAGFVNTNTGTGAAALQARDCTSPVRVALANSYGSFFENNCAAAAGDATGGVCTQIRHVFRRDDFSGTTDTIVSLLNLPSTVVPETTVTVFPGGVSTAITQHTGANPFCNSVRPAFALPGADGVNAQSATNPQVTCLQGADATWDPTQKNLGTGCTKENAVYRSTMQDNDPIRRTCFGAGTGAKGTLGEDTCSHSGDLGLVLVMNDVPETGDVGTTSDPLRYNATACARGKFTSATAPEAYDAVTQTKQICTRGLLCPNGDFCTSTGGCIVPAFVDANGVTNPQCLPSKLTAPPNTSSSQAVPVANPRDPHIAEGRAYTQHLYKLVGTAGAYQPNGFGTAPFATTGAFFRIHTNHSMNPASTATSPIVCQLPDMTDQIGCLVNASPCSVGYAGRSATVTNAATTDAIKIKGQNPTTTCIAGDGASVPAFAYPLSRKLYLDTIPGFGTLTGTEQALAACETDLAQTSSPAGLVTTAIVANGFIQVPGYYNGGEPFCEDFNENMLCGPSATTPTFPANNPSCPTAALTNMNFPLANATTCGDGIQQTFEDCDCGTAQVAASAPASNVTLCGATINGGTVCTTTCRTVH